MTLQQLRYLREVARRGLNISSAANALSTSQPGVSKQLRLLENELAVEIFVRERGRIVELSESGRKILLIAERILKDTDSLREVGKELTEASDGALVIATTHTQARYALPEVLKRFAARYPQVSVHLKHGTTRDIAQLIMSGNADIAIATEALVLFHELAAIPCHSWERVVITAPGHPLLKQAHLTLKHIARYPIIAYGYEFTARQTIMSAFEASGLTPNVVLSAVDADMIKACVAQDMGIAILTRLAFNPERDRNLCYLDASHLFKSSTTYIGIRRRGFLRGYMYDFIEMFSPRLDRRTVELATLD